MFKKLILFNIILAFLIISPISAFNCDSNNTDILEANDNLNENIYYDNLNVSSLNDLNTNENLTNDKIIENNTTFEVPTQKQTLNFTVTTNTTPGGAVTINISTNSNATGNITLETAGKTINTKLINGSANEYLTANPGIYSINLDYSGDDNFNSASLSYFQKYLISDTSSALITPNSNLNMVYKNGTRFVVDLVDSKGNSLGTPDVKSLNRYIYITVNGQFYKKRVGVNGTSLALNLRPGNYVINTFFEGDVIYPASNLSTNLTVLPDLLSSNFTKYYKNDSQYSVSVIDGHGNPIIGKKVKLNINGVFYDRETDSNGIAHLNINLRPGNYTLTAIHPLTSLEIGNTISVLTDLIGNDVTMEYNNGSQYSIMALDDYGNPITGKNLKLNINGVFYDRETDSNGIAHLNITLNPGNYIITAIHPYTDLAISNKINVLFKTNYTVDASNCFSNINLENVSTTNSNTDEVYLDIQTNQLYRGESLNVYLKSNGEVLKVPNIPIQITINGVTYVRNTNNYGIAKLNINLNAQNNPYLVGLYFAGNDNYSGDSKLANLYVAQKNTILTFMSSAVNTGTPLKIKLTDSTYVPIANKVVKITINGVTYERTSNQYGIASLNINLNPQSYVVSTSFDSQGGYASFSTITKTISVIANNNLNSVILTPLNNILNKGDSFKVKLTSNSTNTNLVGKTIAITVNGVTYYKTTDNTGIAQLKINLNMGNMYSIVSNFEGDSHYLATTNYNLIHVVNSSTAMNYSGDWPLEKYKTMQNEYCNYSNSYIQELGNNITLTCSNDLEKSIAIHNYVFRIIYSLYSGPKNSALDSLLLFRGNCVDTTTSLVALSRAVGLPVNYVIGNGINGAAGHAWAQICINNILIISDPTNTELFGDWNTNQGPYINTTRGLLIAKIV